MFKSIIDHFDLGGATVDQRGALIGVLVLEAGLLFVAANTGFLGGPAVLSNMAADSWVPHQFRQLSSRLVTQNGVVLMGVAALAVLFWSQGSVALLVVLYSINVFLTFSISLFGLCIYWIKNRRTARHWQRPPVLSAAGLFVTSGILLILVWEKFGTGGWVTIVITGLVITVCLAIRWHYDETREQLRQIDRLFAGSRAAGRCQPAARSIRKNRPPYFLSAKTAVSACTRCCGCSGFFPSISRTSFF